MFFNITFHFVDAEQETRTSVACARYEVTKIGNNTTVTVYPGLCGESGVEYYVGQDKANDFSVAYVTNAAGKTVDVIRA